MVQPVRSCFGPSVMGGPYTSVRAAEMANHQRAGLTVCRSWRWTCPDTIGSHGSMNAPQPQFEDASALDFDAIIVGAGISGLYQLHLLRQLGLRVRLFEAGSGVGGTWYWNRYPGARFDSESWSYGYSFSPELLAEWSWTEHFAPQPETERYLNFMADKFDLRCDIRFGATVTAMRFAGGAWTVTLADGSTARARYVVAATGPLSAPTLPRFEGIEEFDGTWFHTARWPKEPVDLKGKRVAVVGTGASGVQTISAIASEVGELTVFQRRPNWCTPLNNGPISADEMAEIRANYPEIFTRCRETAACFVHTIDPRGTFEVSEAERQDFWEDRYAGQGFGIWQGNFRDMLLDREANRLVSDFVASKIRQRVHDPEVAERLIPKDHGFGTRRVPQESRYYEAYNRPNVRLVSMLETPVVRVTPTGIETTKESFDFDLIVYATGFDAITGALDRIDVSGPGPEPLKDRWRRSLETFAGVMVDGFPNLFLVVGPHSQLGNIPRTIEYTVEWIRSLIGYMEANGHRVADVRLQAIADWMEIVHEKGEGLLSNEVDSWMTGVNMNVDGKEERFIARYSGTAPEYRAWCDSVAARGYQELQFA
ncbi:MAG: NAD(P)/FAD-dependent oxidoreductase [Pseudomonadota bacterium]